MSLAINSIADVLRIVVAIVTVDGFRAPFAMAGLDNRFLAQLTAKDATHLPVKLGNRLVDSHIPTMAAITVHGLLRLREG